MAGEARGLVAAHTLPFDRLRAGFMLTFTLPAELREVARRHQELFYNLLFRATAAATQKLALDPRFVGGRIGMVGVLHTWGRNLSYHPHVHYLVPGGALADDGETWLSAHKDFLMPVKALSKLFRAKFRDALRKTEHFSQIPASVWSRDWVVHCQPVGDGLGALKYLAPYIFRVAISNNRILSLENDRVTFRYRDSDTGQERVCTLAAEEFMRRFLQHVLPKGFVKVRYYGIFSPGWRKRLAALRLPAPGLRQAGRRLGGESPPLANRDDADKQEDADIPVNAVRCPKCGRIMVKRQRLQARGRCPP